MPQVHPVMEVRLRIWGMMVSALAFFISFSMVLGVLWPLEWTKRRAAEEAKERLMSHADRLTQAKISLKKQLREETERKEAILAILRETQTEVASLLRQVTAHQEQLETILQASAKPQGGIAEFFPAKGSGEVSLGKVVVGSKSGPK